MGNGRPPAALGVEEPTLPENITGRELDRGIRAELSGLRPEVSTLVARHLVAAARFLDEDPALGYAHAAAARRHAPRLASTREALGLAAYLTQRYAEALSELRAARRLSGDDQLLPVLADCERGLGRPERALALASSAAAGRLDRAAQVELRIVAAGARRDLGQVDAAILTLEGRDLSSASREPWVARLRYAYAEALLAAGRVTEATLWFERAADADAEGLTDARERAEVLDGSGVLDVLDEADDAPASE
jgi:tetratricopeptide (TPR) repeat protein